MQTIKARKSVRRELLEWGAALLAAVLAALFIRSFVFEPYAVEGHSMESTLHDREVMFTTKFDYILGAPERFDVVICRYPGRTEHFVKRVVGLPGDVVSIKDGYLYVNGEKMPEAYLDERMGYSFDAYTVPEDRYFVLGDNRNASNDSHLIGPIEREQIVSHVRAVLFPLKQIRGIN